MQKLIIGLFLIVLGVISATIGGYLAKDGWKEVTELSSPSTNSLRSSVPKLINAPKSLLTASDVEKEIMRLYKEGIVKPIKTNDPYRTSIQGDEISPLFANAALELIGKSVEWTLWIDDVMEKKIAGKNYVRVVAMLSDGGTLTDWYFSLETAPDELRELRRADKVRFRGVLTKEYVFMNSEFVGKLVN